MVIRITVVCDLEGYGSSSLNKMGYRSPTFSQDAASLAADKIHCGLFTKQYFEKHGEACAADVYHGRRGDIPIRRQEAKRRTLQARKEDNRNLRELDKGNLTT